MGGQVSVFLGLRCCNIKLFRSCIIENLASMHSCKKSRQFFRSTVGTNLDEVGLSFLTVLDYARGVKMMKILMSPKDSHQNSTYLLEGRLSLC